MTRAAQGGGLFSQGEILPIFPDGLRQRRIGSVEPTPHPRQIGERAAAFDRCQPRDGPAAVGDDDLPALLDVVEQTGQVLPRFTHPRGSHARMCRM